MEGLSPLTQRIVALGALVLLVLLGLRLAVALAGWTSDSLDALHDSRFRLARLEALRTRAPPPPAPPLPAGTAFGGRSHAEAAAAATSAIRAAAGASQLPPPTIGAEPQSEGEPNLVAIRVSATGREAALLGFVAQVERSMPAIRFRSWTLARARPDSPDLTLHGVAVAAWSGR